MNYAELTDNKLHSYAAGGDTAAENELAMRYSRLVIFCLHVYLQARKGHQTSLHMVVSHREVAGN